MRPSTDKQRAYLGQLTHPDRLSGLTSGEAGALVGLLAGLLADRPPAGWSRAQLWYGLGLMVRLPGREAVGALLAAQPRAAPDAQNDARRTDAPTQGADPREAPGGSAGPSGPGHGGRDWH